MRVMREFPKEKLIEGLEKLDLRKDIESDFRKSKESLKEIRMREIGFNKNKIDLDIKLKILEYEASGGKEFFLEFVNKEDILFGLLRLRLYNDESQKRGDKFSRAIVRELHVYGHSVKIGEKEEHATQHTGLGKALLNQAEEITKKHNIKKLSIISGIGVREYYKKLGYNLEGYYMVKKLTL
jgi:elongator complex protein 3